MEAGKQQKDPLFAGLAREARFLGLPTNVFVGALFAVFILFFGVKAMVGGVLKPLLAVTALLSYLAVLTYEEDRGVSFAFFKYRRRLANSKKMFHGYSYDTNPRVKSRLNLDYPFGVEAGKEKMEISKLPYLFHVRPDIVRLANGDLMTTIEFDGINFETESYETLERLKKFRAGIYRRLNSRLVTYVHYVRKEAEPERYQDIGQSFFDDFEEHYYRQQKVTKVFKNRVFVTLVARRNDPNLPLAERLKLMFTLNGKEAENKLAMELESARDTMMESFSSANPRILSVYRRNGHLYDQTLEFLNNIVNLNDSPVPVFPEEIRNYLPSTRKIFKENGVIRFHLSDGTARTGCIFGISNATYPEESDHTMLDSFLTVDHEMIICESFALMDRKTSVRLSQRKQNQLRSADDKSASQIQSINDLVDDLTSGRQINGIFNMNVLVYTKDGESFQNAVTKTDAAFAKANLKSKREDVIAEPSFYSMLPGNMHLIQRPATLNTTNFAGFASLHNTGSGFKDGNHWGKYIMRLKTSSNTLYYFNFHARGSDVGHTRFIASTGGGKTTTLNAFLTGALKHDPFIFHFDFEFSAAVFMTAIGARHTVIMPNEKTGWNPLQLPDTKENRTFLFRWLSFLGAKTNEEGKRVPLKPAEEKKIHEVINQIYSFDPKLRKLGNFIDLFGLPEDGSMAERMQKWCNDGRLASLFDNEEDGFSLEGAKRFCFEMKYIILEPEVLMACSMYIFHRIDTAMQSGRPFIVVMEEGQRYIADEYNKEWLKIMLTTYRRRNGMVVFVTPTPEVITGSADLRQQFGTTILLPNSKASYATYVGEEGLMCSEKEYRWILENDIKSVKAKPFLIKSSSQSVISKMDLTLMPEFVEILSGNEKKYNILQDIIKQVGSSDYRAWAEPFKARLKQSEKEAA